MKVCIDISFGKGQQVQPITETLALITMTAYIKTFASQDPSVSPRPRVTRVVLYWWCQCPLVQIFAMLRRGPPRNNQLRAPHAADSSR